MASTRALRFPNSAREACRSLFLGLCFFHGALAGRQQYRAGWNGPQSFTEADLVLAGLLLRRTLACHPSGVLPWDEVQHLLLDVVYSGGVSSQLDQACLSSLFDRFLSKEITLTNFDFSGGKQAGSIRVSGPLGTPEGI